MKILINYGAIPRKSLTEYTFSWVNRDIGLINYLSEYDVTIIKWKHTDFVNINNFNVIDVDNILEYYDYTLNNKYDAYILDYSLFFSIKAKYPTSTLIGYKSYDGPEEHALDSGFLTLTESKANCIFVNEIAVLPDGSIHRIWNERFNFIKRMLNLKWYKTNTTVLSSIGYSDIIDDEEDLKELLDAIKVEQRGYEYGTVAYKKDGWIISTSRGKRDKLFVKCLEVLHGEYKTILGNKMSLNMPVIDLLFKKYPQYTVLLHGHKQLYNCYTIPHYFDGTSESEDVVKYLPDKYFYAFNVAEHGYYAMFKDIKSAKTWVAMSVYESILLDIL
jgi:hypothetical protein